MNELNDYLESREFNVSGVTFADVIVAYTTEYVCALCITFTDENSLKSYPNLLSHASRVRNLPSIKKNV